VPQQNLHPLAIYTDKFTSPEGGGRDQIGTFQNTSAPFRAGELLSSRSEKVKRLPARNGGWYLAVTVERSKQHTVDYECECLVGWARCDRSGSQDGYTAMTLREHGINTMPWLNPGHPRQGLAGERSPPAQQVIYEQPRQKPPRVSASTAARKIPSTMYATAERPK
jgi:hypothetical protein